MYFWEVPPELKPGLRWCSKQSPGREATKWVWLSVCKKKTRCLYGSIYPFCGRKHWENTFPTCPPKMPHTPMITRILKTAEPTMVPTPTSPLVMNTPETRFKYSYPNMVFTTKKKKKNHHADQASAITLTNQWGKELWSRTSCCHEGGSGNILAQMKFLQFKSC